MTFSPTRHKKLLVLAALLCASVASTAHALTTHQAQAFFGNSFDPAVLPDEFDIAHQTAPGSTSPATAQANVGGIGYNGLSYIAPNGALAIEGNLNLPAVMNTGVMIRDDEIRHPLGVPFRAVANVIVDGGFIEMIDSAPGSSISFSMSTTAFVFGADGNAYNPPTPSSSVTSYGATAEITYDASGVATTMITGDDIGMTVDSSGKRIDIPTTFQNFDFGVVPQGGHIDIMYSANIYADTNPTGLTSGAFTEGTRWRYSDPLSVDTASPALTVSLQPLTAPVPVPAGLPLMISGLLAIGAIVRRRRT